MTPDFLANETRLPAARGRVDPAHRGRRADLGAAHRGARHAGRGRELRAHRHRLHQSERGRRLDRPGPPLQDHRWRPCRGRWCATTRECIEDVHFVTPTVALRGREATAYCAPRTVERPGTQQAPGPALLADPLRRRLTCIATTTVRPVADADRPTVARPSPRSAPPRRSCSRPRSPPAGGSLRRARTASPSCPTTPAPPGAARAAPAADVHAHQGGVRVTGVRGRAERDARTHERRRRTWSRARRLHLRGRDRRLLRRRLRRLRASTPPAPCCAPTTAVISWQILNTGYSATPQAVLALDPQTVLLIGAAGVLRSTDGGNTFSRVRGRIVSRGAPVQRRPRRRPVFAYGSKNIVASSRRGRTWQKVLLPRKTLLHAVDFVARAPGSRWARTARCSRRATAGERWLDLSGVGNDDATGMSFCSDVARLPHAQAVRRRLERLRPAHHRRRPHLAPAARRRRTSRRPKGLPRPARAARSCSRTAARCCSPRPAAIAAIRRR